MPEDILGTIAFENSVLLYLEKTPVEDPVIRNERYLAQLRVNGYSAVMLDYVHDRAHLIDESVPFENAEDVERLWKQLHP